MITQSYSEANGTVVVARVKHNKGSTDTELVIHDNQQNENITITFLDQSSSVFKVGDKIKVRYLPHSHLGMTYSN